MMTSAMCIESAQIEAGIEAHNPATVENIGAPGRTRTCDLRFRKPLLYPLSYGGGDGPKRGAKFAATCCITVDKASAAQLQKEYCPQIPLFMFTGTD